MKFLSRVQTISAILRHRIGYGKRQNLILSNNKYMKPAEPACELAELLKLIVEKYREEIVWAIDDED